MKKDITTEYVRRTARLAALIAEAGDDLELIAYYAKNFSLWADAVAKSGYTLDLEKKEKENE
jgi:hypothetical protein